MTSFTDSLIELLSGLAWVPENAAGIIFVTVSVLVALPVFLFMTLNAMVAVYMERKVSAFMQDRLGPMEVGIFGFKGGKRFWGGIGQTVADAVNYINDHKK